MPITTQQTDVSALRASRTVVALLQQGDRVRFTAAGNSMHPLIPCGSIVIVRPFHTTDAKLGALLLFSYGKRLVLHRLVRVDKRSGKGILCGDMNQQGHECVALAQIQGTAITRMLPNGKERALHIRSVRWAGLLRYHVRPLRRVASRLAQRMSRLRRL